MRVALDSNVLVYSAGVIKAEQDQTKKVLARSLIDTLDTRATVVCPLQTFGEAFSVMQRSGWTREQCRDVLNEWSARFETVASSETAFLAALDLATDHKLQFWDALIISVAADAGCQFLLSEDLQPGFFWRGVRVANPFADVLDPALQKLLAG